MNLERPRTSDGSGWLLSRILVYPNCYGNLTTDTQEMNYLGRQPGRLELWDLDIPILGHEEPEKQEVTKDADGKLGYLRTLGACG